jgi:hypothetical protein
MDMIMGDQFLEMDSRQIAEQLDMEAAMALDAERPQPAGDGKWSIAVEEVWFPCFGSYPSIQVHSSEDEARAAFKALKGPRILLDANGSEVLSACGAPWKRYALRMIRQEIARSALAPSRTARKKVIEDSFDNSDNEFCFSDDRNSCAIELPGKSVPSDLVSTVGDAGSAMTSHSVFTDDASDPRIAPAPVTVCKDPKKNSTQKSGPKDLLSNDSMDICQSTSSSVYRLLDLESTSGSVHGD